MTSCNLLMSQLFTWSGWEGLGAGGEGDNRGWDGWMASLTQWTWVWVNSGSGWWTGKPGVLRFMGSQRVGHDWATELNWTELNLLITSLKVLTLNTVTPGFSFPYMNFEEPQILSPSHTPGALWQHQDSPIYQCPYFWPTTATAISYHYFLLLV